VAEEQLLQLHDCLKSFGISYEVVFCIRMPNFSQKKSKEAG